MVKSVIYNIRKFKGTTREELSQLSNINNYRLRSLEKNTDDITKKELYSISEALDCSIFDIISLSELDNEMLEDLRNRIDKILETR